MKPLLIIPPIASRWPALAELLTAQQSEAWLRDLEQRVVRGVPGASDAVAVLPTSGTLHASGAISKCDDVGILRYVYTDRAHRGRGYARQVTEALLSWFDMTGGKWLVLSTTAELDVGLYRKFGFQAIRRAVWAPFDRITMLRTRPGLNTDPLADAQGPLTTRILTRADWPAMVTMLQYWAGPDPRVPLHESAVTAELLTLDLLAHADHGACVLLGACHGPRLVAMATLSLPNHGGRTYAMLMPHANAPPDLRRAVLDYAHERGVAQVDFPMESLGRGFAPDVPAPKTPPAPAAPPEQSAAAEPLSGDPPV